MKKLFLILLTSNLVINLSAQNKNTIKTQSLSDEEISIPSSLTITNKYIWLPKLVSLPAVISYDVKFNDERDEFIPVYSYNKVKWGNNNPEPDALSWYLSPQNRDFTFRTGLFKSNPDVKKGEKIKIETGKLYNLTCVIYKSSAIYFVDGKPYAKAIYDVGTVPKKGYFGFAVWGIANINVTNIKLVSVNSYDTEESKSITLNLKTKSKESKDYEHNGRLQVYNLEEVMELNDLLYKKKDTTLITGKVIDYDINEKIMIEVNYKDGKEEGMTKLWYENGQPQFETDIRNGQPEGMTKLWYENGQLEKEVKFINGVQEGLLREWYENGQLKTEGNFKEDKQDGLGKMWYENGQQKAEQFYIEGIQEGLLKEWYENGQLQGEANYKEGKPEGISKVWFKNGQLAKEANFISGVKDGLSREWYDNGQQKIEQPFKKGKQEGLYRQWYDNGQLEQEVDLIDGVRDGIFREWYENGKQKAEQFFKMDKPEGISRFWYDNGQLSKEHIFKDGQAEGVNREWYDNGQLKQQVNLIGGILEGLYREWYDNGQLKQEAVFKNGEPEGLAKVWDENGKLLKEVNFTDANRGGLTIEIYENEKLKEEKTFKDGKQEGVEKVWNTDGKLIKEALPETATCYVEGETPTLINTFNYSGHKYQYMKMNVSWDIAKQLAEKEGGYLAVFETLEEMNHVTAASEIKATYWIGLSDSKKEGNWTWINGTALNKNMEGYLEKGNDLENRDYGHIMTQGGLLSREISGRLPKEWKGGMCVSGYLVEFDSID